MLSVIIPAYNEERRIEPTIERIFDFGEQRDIDLEIIVVDDGSTDDTGTIARRMEGVTVLGGSVNRGKGWAVREGMKRARGDVVLFTDADMSTPIEEADKLFEKIKEGYDLAVGSRMAGRRLIKKYQPWHRILLGQLFGLVVRVILPLDIKDTQCGFKMFTSDAVSKLAPEMTIDGYVFDVEMLVLARRMGFGIAEVGVVWKDIPGSKLNIFRDFPKIAGELVKIGRGLRK